MSIVRRVRLFREHNALLKALKKVIDSKKVRSEAKYVHLNHDLPLGEDSSDSDSEISSASASASSSSESESSFAESQGQTPKLKSIQAKNIETAEIAI